MRLNTIAGSLGLVFTGFGVIILAPIIVALLENEYSSVMPFATASICGIGFGLYCQWQGGWKRNFDTVKKTECLLIVTLAWLGTAAIGAIPYLFYGLTPLDAYFESISGITTTGATILTDFSLYPKDFFFWRSLTQWLGGMGIIVLFIAIMPQFAVAGRQMFFAEAPGPTEEKITPRIAHTAKALWLIYGVLTIMEIILLCFSGMPVFDAICNGLSTMAAGGFSPHPQSILGYNNPTATWIITFFMLLAGANFALQYRLFVQMKPMYLFRSEEFRFYLTIILLLSAALCGFLYFAQGISFHNSLRDSLFQIISIITTTGFSSSDFSLWLVPAQALLLTGMFVGGCAGSSGGGIKVVRLLFVGKYLKKEILQTLHPQAVLPVKIDKTAIPEDIQRQMLSFLLFYIFLMIFSGFIVTILEGDASIGFIGTAATIGNIGPGLGEIGPMGSFGKLSDLTKVIMIINMVTGRLELIPVLVMFHSDFWKFK